MKTWIFGLLFVFFLSATSVWACEEHNAKTDSQPAPSGQKTSKGK